MVNIHYVHNSRGWSGEGLQKVDLFHGTFDQVDEVC